MPAKEIKYRVLNEYGMITTDARGVEHDHKPGAVLTVEQLNTAQKHIDSLVKCGDLEKVEG